MRSHKELLQLELNQDWVINTILPRGGLMMVAGQPKVGKAVSLDTLIPTPDGYKPMSDIKTGDYVYGSEGLPTQVVAESEIFTNRPCFKVTFAGGHSVTVDAEHEWGVYNRQLAAKYQIITTKELLEKGISTKSANYRKNNYYVKCCSPLQYTQSTSVPIDPYVLGAWLGDGSSGLAQITSNDPELIDEITRRGHPCKKLTAKYLYSIANLSPLLKSADLLKNKHIPKEYFTASVEVRLDLLRGLLDTDGSAERARAVFYNTNKQLADGVYRLSVELGFKTSRRIKRAILNGVDHGECYCINIRPNINVFKLPRKAAILEGKLNHNEKYYSITEIEEVESVPTKCIQVAAPDHLYLVTEACIPTHNSLIALDICEAIGNPQRNWFHGFQVEHRGPVLYVNLDMPTGSHRRRFLRLENNHNFKFGNLWHITRDEVPAGFDILKEGNKNWLLEQVSKLKPAVIIMDVVRRLYAGDENSSDIAAQVIASVNEIIQEGNSSAILVHHTNKTNEISKNMGIEKDPINAVRGSSVLAGSMDTICAFNDNGTELAYQGRDINLRYAIKRAPTGLHNRWIKEKASNRKIQLERLIARYLLQNAELSKNDVFYLAQEHVEALTLEEYSPRFSEVAANLDAFEWV